MLAELILLQQLIDDKKDNSVIVGPLPDKKSYEQRAKDAVAKYRQAYQDYIARGRKGYGL